MAFVGVCEARATDISLCESRWSLALPAIALGVIKALVKPLARRFVQRHILAAAPLLFRQLDPLLPALLQRCSGAELEQVVRQKLEALTGESWATDDLGQMSDDAFSRWLEGATPEELELWQP